MILSRTDVQDLYAVLQGKIHQLGTNPEHEETSNRLGNLLERLGREATTLAIMSQYTVLPQSHLRLLSQAMLEADTSDISSESEIQLHGNISSALARLIK